MQSRFQRFADKHNIKNTEIAGLLRLDVSTISKKKSGVRPWTDDEMNAVRQYCARRVGRHVTLDELFRRRVVKPDALELAGAGK